jgi:hypothetical protein
MKHKDDDGYEGECNTMADVDAGDVAEGGCRAGTFSHKHYNTASEEDWKDWPDKNRKKRNSRMRLRTMTSMLM